MKGELNRTIMIYVDSYENGVPTGYFHIAANEEVQSFQSLSQLLLKINDTLDREKFPQSFSEMRKFQKPWTKSVSTVENGFQKKGQAATFIIRILFRQNSSWQGTIQWVEGKQDEYFRSVLELIVLMDNALGYAENN